MVTIFKDSQMFIQEREWRGKTFFLDRQKSIKEEQLQHYASTKLHRVHMAVRSNATVIFLVALLWIWLKCRLKTQT